MTVAGSPPHCSQLLDSSETLFSDDMWNESVIRSPTDSLSLSGLKFSLRVPALIDVLSGSKLFMDEEREILRGSKKVVKSIEAFNLKISLITRQSLVDSLSHQTNYATSQSSRPLH